MAQISSLDIESIICFLCVGSAKYKVLIKVEFRKIRPFMFNVLSDMIAHSFSNLFSSESNFSAVNRTVSDTGL